MLLDRKQYVRCCASTGNCGGHSNPWKGAVTATEQSVDWSGRPREHPSAGRHKGAVGSAVPAIEPRVCQRRPDELQVNALAGSRHGFLNGFEERFCPFSLQGFVLWSPSLDRFPKLVRFGCCKIRMQAVLSRGSQVWIHHAGHADYDNIARRIYRLLPVPDHAVVEGHVRWYSLSIQAQVQVHEGAALLRCGRRPPQTFWQKLCGVPHAGIADNGLTCQNMLALSQTDTFGLAVRGENLFHMRVVAYFASVFGQTPC
mmetsp:Transcript_64787/g.152325  ORF Transcript_64787/g.152325 Transcript_64787/m.152325 type:complete len:257 (-) Transcript_64787:554-1324(-)